MPTGAWEGLSTSGPYPEALQHLRRDAHGEWFRANPWRTRPRPELLRTALHAGGEPWLPVEAEPG